MAELGRVFEQAREVVARIASRAHGTGHGPASVAPPKPPTAAELAAHIDTFTRTWRWRVRVPGTHPDGLAYDELLAHLGARGFDFLAETVQLRLYVAKHLRAEFRGAAALPSRAAMQRVAAPRMLEHIERRFTRGGHDVSFPRLAAKTLAAKARKGRGGYPTGVNTGATRAALSRAGKIVFLD